MTGDAAGQETLKPDMMGAYTPDCPKAVVVVQAGSQSMTVAHATYQQRAHLTSAGHERLAEVLAMCATLYNAALQERRDAYRMAGKSISRIDQFKSLVGVRKDDPAWEQLDSNIGRGVLCRVDRAFQSFFRRVKAGQTPGFPRFRPSRRSVTIELSEVRPGMVKVRPDGRKARVRIKGLPVIELRLKRTLPNSQSIKSLRIVRRPNGVYVDLVYAVEKEPLSENPESVGIDLGVNNRLALSDGRMVEPRAANRDRETSLRQAVARSHKGSKTRGKRVKALSKETRRNAVSNRNAVHRLTTGLIRDYGRIAVEKLAIQNMTASAKGTVESPGVNVKAKSGLNREIVNQTWGMILSQLRYKAEWAGRELVEVDPRNTSRKCHACGEITPQAEYRVHRCSNCGQESDRDTNAAINILKRSFGEHHQEHQTGVGKSPLPSERGLTVSPGATPAGAGAAQNGTADCLGVTLG